jgi:hypothetical protein
MYAESFDHFAKTYVAVGSRRWMIGGLLGGLLGVSRFGAAGANHKTGHYCTPSDNHPCPAGQTCREVSGEWTCEISCYALGEVCATDNDCCEGLQCCPGGLCESDIDNCDGLD